MKLRSAMAIGASLAWLAYVSTTILGFAMDAPVGRDESMYLSGAVLSRTLSIYADFPFLQMPYGAWALGPFLPDPANLPLLLTGRLINVGISIGCLMLVVLLAHRSGAGWWRGMILATMLPLQPALTRAVSEVNNHVLPGLFALAALTSLATFVRSPERRWALGLAGVFLGLATGARLTWLFVLCGFWLVIWLAPRSSRAANLRWFSLGATVSLVPAGIAALRDPGAFLFQNFGYHAANRAWAAGSPEFATDRAEFWRWLTSLAESQYSQPILIAFVGSLVIQVLQRRWTRIHWVRMVIAVSACGLAAAVPSPWWPKHSIPFLFALVAATTVLCTGVERYPRTLNAILALSLVLAVTAHLDRNLRMIGGLSDPESWIPVRFEQELSALRGLDPDLPVTSLSPLCALEAGYAIDPRSTGGPFLVRSRRVLDERQIRAARGGTELLTVDPDRPLYMTGVDPEYEEDLAERLAGSGYERYYETPSGFVLWKRRSPAGD